MAWQERLGKVEVPWSIASDVPGRALIAASFRGVPFFVESAELSGGRRTAISEFPLRDVPFAEDLGRRARVFPIEGYVLGPDYLAARDALLSALEQAGSGELLHPYYGRRRVVVSTYRVRETSAEGGIARFGVEFQETDLAPSFPSSVPATAQRVASSYVSTVMAIQRRLGAGYNIAGQPLETIASLSDVLSSASAKLTSALSPVISDVQQLATVRRALDKLGAQALALAQQPADMIGALGDAFAAIVAQPLLPQLGLRALLDAYGFTPTVARPGGATPMRQREQANYDVLLWATKTLIAVQAAQMAPGETWDSYDAAIAGRNAIVDALDAQLEGADDDSYIALDQLRADLVRAVPGEDQDLPRLMHYTPAFTQPSLVLAYSLYGDLSREADLCQRNHVPYPGFVKGGVELEVLARAD